MPDHDFALLSAPVAEDAPCGPNLEYDAAFQAMEDAAAGKPEQQYGDKIIPARPTDWPEVQAQARALALRTRDLRVMVWLVRSAARVEGLVAAVRALQALQRLIDQQWTTLHPQLEDGTDATARVNALLPLAHDAGLADFRAAGLLQTRGTLRVRDLERAFGHAEALPGEAAIDVGDITAKVAAACAQSADLATAMAEGVVTVDRLAATLQRQLGAAQAPELTALSRLFRAVADAHRSALGATAAADDEAAAVDPPQAAAASGDIRSRDDAMRALERVSEWIARNEPTNPAPLLIDRARRLMTKNFIDLIRDLAPDSLGQIQRLAGTTGD